MRWLAGAVCIALGLTGALAQEEDPALVTSQEVIETRLDAFGIEQTILRGIVTNEGDQAYDRITLLADLFDEDGDVIGEGFGYVVDACGVAVLDAPLQPGQSRDFLATLDLYNGQAVADYAISFISTSVEPESTEPPAGMIGVGTVTRQEVVSVQWQGDERLLYGVGCPGALFTRNIWFDYDLTTDTATALQAHPDADAITPAMLRQTAINRRTQDGSDDPTLLDRSFLSFPVETRRIIWQTDINALVTAERDGAFRRVITTEPYIYSLQGFVWSPSGNVVAYYYGAYGEPVRYLIATMAGQQIGASLANNPPSQTVPGLTYDGRRVIISGAFGEQTGYFFQSTVGTQRILLFETDELPGNNWPAPAYYLRNEDTRYIYFVRPVDGQATLQCYHVEAQELMTLTPLPLQLAIDERASTWLSPSARWLAVAATGDHGGLWLIDLDEFDVCR